LFVAPRHDGVVHKTRFVVEVRAETKPVTGSGPVSSLRLIAQNLQQWGMIAAEQERADVARGRCCRAAEIAVCQ
jgi:hypothetical protein